MAIRYPPPTRQRMPNFLRAHTHFGTHCILRHKAMFYRTKMGETRGFGGDGRGVRRKIQPISSVTACRCATYITWLDLCAACYEKTGLRCVAKAGGRWNGLVFGSKAKEEA